MKKSTDNDQPNVQGKEFQIFVWARIIGGLVIAVALIWGTMKLIDFVYPDSGSHSPEILYSSESHGPMHDANDSQSTQKGDAHSAEISPYGSDTYDTHGAASKGPKGVAFVEALTASMDYELNERFWGWRPNDLIKFTDNVNEYQLGVLEVTRRTTTRLTENISRTGSTAVINKHLERAMNSLMIRADRYLFPSAENQYRQAIENLNRYKEQLIRNEASFYTRTDNLIPLLQSLVELVGSCDEKLVKRTEDNGEPVSTFAADNYYYYSKGVASALLPILHAIEYDFSQVLETRSGSEILHHAIESCHHAAEMKPWLFVTEGNLNGIIANHRANMATAISHARFYLGLLVVTLST
ncbi:MAG: DUF2333 family protein [Desulfobacteraceae bacterium]|nr:DUF2333 family protein [Desulfobacteraceae bacterium]MBC2754197.1 DUF2333 family protein [Desulfobacteraceae bacterium]